MDWVSAVDGQLAAGRQVAEAVYQGFRVDRAATVEPTPGGDVEKELYRELERRVLTGEQASGRALRACGIISVHRPAAFTQLFDAFLENVDRYFASPPVYPFMEQAWYLPEIPPLYAALAIVIQTDADAAMANVVDAVMAVEQFWEDGFEGELTNLMANHPETIPTVATYFEHPDPDVRYLVARGAALTLEGFGAFPEVMVPDQYEPLVEAAVEHGLTDSDDRVVYRSALTVYFAAVADNSPVPQYESQIEQRLADCENEDAAHFLESTLESIQ